MADNTKGKDFFIKITTIQMLLFTLVFSICLISFKTSEEKAELFLSEYAEINAKDMSYEEIKELFIKKPKESEENEPEQTTTENKEKQVDNSLTDEKATQDIPEQTNTVDTISDSAIFRRNGISSAFLSSQIECNPVFPVKGSVTSSFGGRVSPIYNYDENHKGVDIAARMGSTIRAVMDGIVSDVDYTPGRGNFVIIDHKNTEDEKIQTLYQHCKKILVEPGTVVRAGEAIALVGSTGDSTGPHLHLEYRVNGECLDPIKSLFGDSNAI